MVNGILDDAALLGAEAGGVNPGRIADDFGHQQMALELGGQQLDAMGQLRIDLRQSYQVLAGCLPHFELIASDVMIFLLQTRHNVLQKEVRVGLDFGQPLQFGEAVQLRDRKTKKKKNH